MTLDRSKGLRRTDTNRLLSLYRMRFGFHHEAAKRIEELEAALAWYGEQARLARLIHSEGDTGRRALADDGGKRARDVLNRNQT